MRLKQKEADTNCQFAELSNEGIVRIYNRRNFSATDKHRKVTNEKKTWKTSGIVEKDIKKALVVTFLACHSYVDRVVWCGAAV